jgi:hypothetical protein
VRVALPAVIQWTIVGSGGVNRVAVELSSRL